MKSPVLFFSCKLTYKPIIQNEDHVRKNFSQLYIFAPETHFFKKKAGINPSFASNIDPSRIRTCDRSLRRRMLYPAEL